MVFGVNWRSFRGVRRGFWRENGNLVCFFVVNYVEILGCFGCLDVTDFGYCGGVGRVYGYPMKRVAVGERKKGGLLYFRGCFAGMVRVACRLLYSIFK